MENIIKMLCKEAEHFIPFSEPIDESIVAWAEMHGWDSSIKEDQLLIARQAYLNAIIKQIPKIRSKSFPSPLDSLEIRVSEHLFELILKAAKESTSFDFWGELYSTLIPQTRRRRLGQFWTSQMIADWMVSWIFQFSPECLVDIGCGSGSFLLSSSDILASEGIENGKTLYGWDISPLLLNITLANFSVRGTDISSFPSLSIRNFINAELPLAADAIVCNPPYTRHHHIAPSMKDRFHKYFRKHLSVDISRLATLAFYFLLKIIAEMAEGAHAAIIVPMEVLDARYGKTARQVLCQHTTLSALIHFAPEMNAFQNVDVGASILFFKKGYTPRNIVRHITLTSLPSTSELLELINLEKPSPRKINFGELKIQSQDAMANFAKWATFPEASLSRWKKGGQVVLLKDIANVMRGIATGANDFFVLPDNEMQTRSLEPFIVRTIHRNREIQDILLDEAGWQNLQKEGKHVWLLYLNNTNLSRPPNLEEFLLGGEKPKTKHSRSLLRLRDYIAEGEMAGYHKRSLVQTRKRWYLMEQREIPPIFFTLLTRGNPRFILNRAGVRPLNMFLLIYPNSKIINQNAVEILWALLNSEFSLSRLHTVSRTYGGKTLKVEPGELRNLPVINPFFLSMKDKQRIRELVQAFFIHRQSKTFTSEINALVSRVLKQN
ncbi:MAG: N-6 DNA methylase [Candidatus Hodarchaeales archaeon]|jgi:hypothetical protein